MRTQVSPPRIATILTVLILLLVPVATVIGLFASGFYRDTTWMIPQARGQDLITLVVAEPLLLVSLLAAWRGHFSAPLLRMGALSYLLYTYAMYSYTTRFNALFLVYVALFSATLFALIDLLVDLDVTSAGSVIRRAGSTSAVRAVAGFLAFVGLLFLVAWLGQIVPAVLNGTVPQVVVQAKTPTSAVHVQDLAVVIPLLFAAALRLWQRRVWGYVLGANLLVLTDVMLIALLAMGLFSAQAGIAGALDMFPVFAVLAVVSLGFTALFFAQLRPTGARRAEKASKTDGTGPTWASMAGARDRAAPRERETASTPR